MSKLYSVLIFFSLISAANASPDIHDPSSPFYGAVMQSQNMAYQGLMNDQYQQQMMQQQQNEEMMRQQMMMMQQQQQQYQQNQQYRQMYNGYQY